MNRTPDLPDKAAALAYPAAAPDLDRYRHHVAHLDLSEARKTELLQAVQQIMRSFVDRAFGDDAAQLCRNSVDSGEVAREGEDLAVIDLQPISEFKGTGEIAPVFNEQGGCDRRERT